MRLSGNNNIEISRRRIETLIIINYILNLINEIIELFRFIY